MQNLCPYDNCNAAAIISAVVAVAMGADVVTGSSAFTQQKAKSKAKVDFGSRITSVAAIARMTATVGERVCF